MTSINGETGKNGFKLRLDYEVTKQNTADNKSTVHMVLYLYANTTGSYNHDGDAYWSINGKKTYYTFSYTSPAWYVLGERTEEISHNNDGTKTVTLRGEWCSAISGGWAPYSLSVSGEVTLPTIPRATVPSMGAATIGEKVHISLPRASSGFTHTLRYVFGGASETIDTGVGAGYDWPVPESLAAQIPNAASGKGTLTCETYSGSTLIGSKTIAFTASVPGSMKPAITPGWAAVSYDNSGTKASGIAAWVQGYSKAKAVFNGSKVTCKQGASIAKYAVTYLGKTVEESPYRTETISTTSATVRCTVTDSRGLTAWEDFNISLLEYTPPALVGADLFRSDGEGTAADGGLHIAGVARARYSDLGGQNSVTLKGYWKSVGGSYGAGETLTVGTVGLVTGNVEISTDRSYIALLVLTDSLGNSARYEENIPTERVAFHLKEGGNGAAFGTYAQQDGLTCAWDAEFSKNVSVGGSLSANSITAADIIIGGKSLLDFLHPVGSYYWSDNATSPATLFGGTWVKVEGRFLLGSGGVYSVGDTGGEAEHTLTVEEMPSHRHPFAGSGDFSNYDGRNSSINKQGSAYSGEPGLYNGADYSSSGYIAMQYTGGGAAHNNMPPYYTTNIWRRTA